MAGLVPNVGDDRAAAVPAALRGGRGWQSARRPGARRDALPHQQPAIVGVIRLPPALEPEHRGPLQARQSWRPSRDIAGQNVGHDRLGAFTEPDKTAKIVTFIYQLRKCAL